MPSILVDSIKAGLSGYREFEAKQSRGFILADLSCDTQWFSRQTVILNGDGPSLFQQIGNSVQINGGGHGGAMYRFKFSVTIAVEHSPVYRIA